MFPTSKNHQSSVSFGVVGPGGKGMTLIEVVLAMGILAVALASTMSLVMSIVEQSKRTAMEISSSHVINEQVEMVRTISEDNIDADGTKINKASMVLKRFRTAFAGKSDSFGPNGAVLDRLEEDAAAGRLVYRFWVPAPGESRWLESDRRFKKNHLAVGEISFYLDEYLVNEVVLPEVGHKSAGELPWRPLKGKTPAAPTPAEEPTGFDLDLDGVISGSPGMLADSEVMQLPIKIELVYYATSAQQTELYRISRYALVTDITDPTENFDPTRN